MFSYISSLMPTEVVDIALHDALQVLLLATCVFFGWLLWSTFLAWLDNTWIGQARLADKLKAMDLTMERSRSDSASKETTISRDEQSSAAPQAARQERGLAILEHYGVLGAAAGTWSSQQCQRWTDEDCDI
mmetsp:Transcript_20018/g.46605  ORF Transcript_20018/g.46605 Transcript_20018/m.46605 type:complete len:131 (+) Transcript_20018:155-547(+)